MEFDEFLNKLEGDYNPDKAYKLYLQTQISILQEIIIAKNLINHETFDKLEEKILNKVIELQNKKNGTR